MILPPPGFAQPIPDPSWRQLTEQEFTDLLRAENWSAAKRVAVMTGPGPWLPETGREP